MLGWIVGAVIVVVLVIFFVALSNRFEKQKVKIDEAKSGIDVALTKRYDTLNKMFQMAKGYLQNEQQFIIETIALRKNMQVTEQAGVEERLQEASRQINAVAEAYPALTAQPLFVELQKAVADTEEHLQAARRLYNSNVSVFNQEVAVFPSSVVAGVKGLSKLPMFEADEEKKTDVNLSL